MTLEMFVRILIKLLCSLADMNDIENDFISDLVIVVGKESKTN